MLPLIHTRNINIFVERFLSEKDFTAAGKDKDDQGILSVKKKGGDNSTKKKNDNFKAETTKSTAQSLEENRNLLLQPQNEMNKNSEELQRGVGWKKDCTGSGSADDLLKFIDSSPTPYHVVQTSAELLKDAGFQYLDEKNSWKGKLTAGGKYFYHRNGSTLVAFTIGQNYQPGNEFKIIGANTDSPVLKVKPVSKRTAFGYLQTREEENAFIVNKETHLQPILTQLEGEMNKEDGDSKHSSLLLQLLADELGVAVDQIVDMELTLADTQPGATWGPKNEFLSSPRLDNQVHCYTGLTALSLHGMTNDDTGVSMLVCFDHEEIGSDSAQGAGSPVMNEAIARVVGSFDPCPELLKITIRKSMLISADVAHAIHPNYSDKHEKQHQPAMNKGTVIKTNQNQRYATNVETGFILRELARRAGVPVQEFVVRNDSACGSTIGPILASGVGLRTVDLGISSLSMHSIRETMGCQDVVTNIKLFQQFFKEFGALDSQCDM